MRTDEQRIGDTYQPMQPWVIRHLLGPLAGRLWALSMCRPTPKMEQVAVEAFSDLDPCFIRALQSSSFRRRCRKARKREMLTGLKAEAREHKWKLLRLFLNELEDSLHRQGYRPDDRRIPKVGELEVEYTARTDQLINELYSRPEILAEVFPAFKTLGGVRARSALPFLDGGDNYYKHLISLIYEIRSQPNMMKLSKRHVGYLIRGLAERLPPEVSRLISELQSLQVDEGGSGLKILVNELLKVVSAEDKILSILPIIMRYFLIESMPSMPGDEASSYKRLPLDDEMAELVADGQVYTGARYSKPNGMKPQYNLPTHEESLDDSERLARFAMHVGISMDDLTPKEQQRLVEIMNALDMDYGFASKKGLSIADYYGDRADSEKTQRQRLFKKIKRLRSSNG